MQNLVVATVGAGFSMVMVVDDEKIRTETSEFGPEDVFRVREVHLLNENGSARFLCRFFKDGMTVFSQHAEPGENAYFGLPNDQQFDTWALGTGVTAAPLL